MTSDCSTVHSRPLSTQQVVPKHASACESRTSTIFNFKTLRSVDFFNKSITMFSREDLIKLLNIHACFEVEKKLLAVVLSGPLSDLRGQSVNPSDAAIFSIKSEAFQEEIVYRGAFQMFPFQFFELFHEIPLLLRSSLSANLTRLRIFPELVCSQCHLVRHGCTHNCQHWHSRRTGRKSHLTREKGGQKNVLENLILYCSEFLKWLPRLIPS